MSDRRLITSPPCKNCRHTQGSHSNDHTKCWGKDCPCPGFEEKPEPLVRIDGIGYVIPDARRLLHIPEDACFGCCLGDDGPDTHDRCWLGEA